MTDAHDMIDRRRFLGMAVGVTAVAIAGGGIADSIKPQEAFSFAVIADPHCAEGPRNGMEESGDGVEKLLHCFKLLEELPSDEKPDFALLAGDIHPAALAPRVQEIHLPVHAVAGNHEGSAESRGLLRSLFPDDFGTGNNARDYYSFVHKGVRFIGLCDAGIGGDHVGHFSSELISPEGQCEWLEEELSKSEAHKVVFAHIPPAMDGGDRTMYMGRNDSRWFVELIDRSAPDLLFFGHLHHATEAYQIGRARAFNVRSCCWNFNDVPIGFMLVNVSATGMETRELFSGKNADIAYLR